MTLTCPCQIQTRHDCYILKMGKDCYHRRIQSVKKIVSSYELSAFSLNLLTGESSEVNYGACDVLVADTVPQV